jgi:hypothetical protein
MVPSSFVRDSQFGDWPTSNFCRCVADTDRNPHLEEMIACALDPTRRNDFKIVEAWMTPAFVLAWDLITWLEENVAEWCRTHLPGGDECGYFHLVDNSVDEGAERAEFDPGHNMLHAALIAGAAWTIDFDAVADVLLADANHQDVMHRSFRELSQAQPDRAGLADLPDRPEHEQPRDEDGALTTQGMMRFTAEQRFDQPDRRSNPSWTWPWGEYYGSSE